jgi:trehalose/maltose hydrolase-like predicted phosphorylase
MKKILLLVVFISSSIITAQNDGWHINTKDNSDYTGIAIANGRIGMLTSSKPLQIQHVVLNNVYDVDPNLKVSQILHGMNFGNLDMYIDGEKITEDNISNWQQTMDMKNAAFTTEFNYQDKAKVSCTVYALRNLQYTGYIDISIEATKEIDVKVTGKILTPKEYQTPKNTFQILKDLETTMPILQSVANSPFGKHLVSTSGTFIWHKINSSREDQRPE